MPVPEETSPAWVPPQDLAWPETHRPIPDPYNEDPYYPDPYARI